ncbi:MAG: DMT family transporter [Rhodospirillaceae bacterium]|nr:DMT family transporter [Rhodospirillaceae bacterium]MBT6512882.1 DMT family transporter [Rhodospirillaceae bacterium]MBT7614808.1 DMT family transporter [Rhodospirillaceae bacterium]MBT7645417.1 DMT family transporter [Rhodospirillaceae bacterium]
MTTDAAARATWSTWGLLVLMGAAWGLEFSMLKLTAEAGYPPIGTLMAALAMVATAYWTVLIWRRAWFRVNCEVLLFLLMIAGLGYVLPLIAVLWAAPHVDAGLMTLIASFTPIVTVATAVLFRTETVSWRRILAVMIGLASALLVLVPQAHLPEAGILGWLLLVFVVPLTYGVESVYVSVYWPQGLTPLQIGAGQSLVALLAVIPIHFLTEDPMVYDRGWNMGQIAIVIVAACLLVEVVLYFVIIRDTGGVLVSFGMYLSLFAGIAWGVIIFAERFDALTWLAVAVLVIGLSLTMPRRQQS